MEAGHRAVPRARCARRGQRESYRMREKDAATRSLTCWAAADGVRRRAHDANQRVHVNEEDRVSTTTPAACSYAPLKSQSRFGPLRRLRRLGLPLVVGLLLTTTVLWGVSQFWMIEYDGGAFNIAVDPGTVTFAVMTGPRQQVMEFAYGLEPMRWYTRRLRTAKWQFPSPQYRTWRIFSSSASWHQVVVPFWIPWLSGIVALIGCVSFRRSVNGQSPPTSNLRSAPS